MEALNHGGLANDVKVEIQWIAAENNPHLIDELMNVHGILIPGGFGERGIAGKMAAIRFARERKIPFFGICLGMQLAVIEGCRNLLGLTEASSTEFGATTVPVVGLMTEWLDKGTIQRRSEGDDLGGTMRVGSYPCTLVEGSLAKRAYNRSNIEERHRHRYEVNMTFREALESVGYCFTGVSPDGALPEILERPEHPWFLAVQFHPELKSKPLDPHPLFVSFIKSAIHQERLV